MGFHWSTLLLKSSVLMLFWPEICLTSLVPRLLHLFRWRSLGTRLCWTSLKYGHLNTANGSWCHYGVLAWRGLTSGGCTTWKLLVNGNHNKHFYDFGNHCNHCHLAPVSTAKNIRPHPVSHFPSPTNFLIVPPLKTQYNNYICITSLLNRIIEPLENVVDTL